MKAKLRDAEFDTCNVGTENIKTGDSRDLLKHPTPVWKLGIALIIIVCSPFIAIGFLFEWARSAFEAGRSLADDIIEG